MPVFSVVVPTYNRAEKVCRAIKSVLNQSFSDFEILVMDDGSTDNTCEVVKELADPRIKYEWAKNFGGPAAPRNRGISLAKGKYIAFLDSDDWWIPTKLEESLAILDQGFDLVYHDLFIVKKTNQKLFLKKTHSRKLNTPVFNDLLKHGNGLFNSSVVAKKEVLNEINGLSEDPNLIATEDYDLWLRFSKVSEKFKMIPKTLGYYWSGGDNISSKHQSFKIFTTLEKRYAEEIIALGFPQGIYWMNYHKGMCCYNQGGYDLASRFLWLIKGSEAPLSIRIKSYWIIFLIHLLHAK
ncbi:MAG: glycosyl transferase [Nitrosomonadaceae bacterium]|nr:glycosyl transferase [Nitrosomonadaceae bacterium]|tara:strand:+ start:1089 stop:1973 length:885 start_codon:yes stop_codon:yes gene_type:complete